MSDSNESASSQSALPGDGKYIVAEQLDSSGNVTGKIQLEVAQVDEVFYATNKKAYKDALATVQNDSGAFEVDTTSEPSIMNTFLFVIAVSLFMCIGAIAVRTLLRSFEK